MAKKKIQTDDGATAQSGPVAPPVPVLAQSGPPTEYRVTFQKSAWLPQSIVVAGAESEQDAVEQLCERLKRSVIRSKKVR